MLSHSDTSSTRGDTYRISNEQYDYNRNVLKVNHGIQTLIERNRYDSGSSSDTIVPVGEIHAG